jgi:ankyrin repeat protein
MTTADVSKPSLPLGELRDARDWRQVRMPPLECPTQEGLLKDALEYNLQGVAQRVGAGERDELAFVVGGSNLEPHDMDYLRQLYCTLLLAGHPVPRGRGLEYMMLLLLDTPAEQAPVDAALETVYPQLGWTEQGMTRPAWLNTKRYERLVGVAMRTTALTGHAQRLGRILDVTGGRGEDVATRAAERIFSALSMAARGGHPACLNLLLACAEEIQWQQAPNGAGTCMVLDAVRGNQVALLRQLAAAGYDLSVEIDGRQAIDWATTIAHFNEDMIVALMDLGADPNGAKANRHEALLRILMHGDQALFEYVMSHGVRFAPCVEREVKPPGPLIVRAGGVQAPWALPSLLSAGADVNAADFEGMTCLIKSAQGGDVATVQALLEAGARADAQNHMGRGALWHAAKGGHLEAYLLLLEAGANPGAVDVDGQTPETVATGDVDAWLRRGRLGALAAPGQADAPDAPPRL